ncbi:hypothetical protein UF75_4459 [Desulfosporosinus sp. I2]|uniref:tyrosine-type recombinase/integrase n=1 Tax=Desulfosporosinus sp. I2 TaxID=1617025 RepID=UPI0005F065DE|nr:site-specific integrase [Desulfosporosinus sp. I2]KJR45154.1 hypothetical protein UF75_4459 [Desulfosporosinus sp. I2]
MSSYASYWLKNFARISRTHNTFIDCVANYKSIYNKKNVSIEHFIQAFKSISESTLESYFYNTIQKGIESKLINPRTNLTDRFMTKYFFGSCLLIQFARNKEKYGCIYLPYRKALKTIETEYKQIRAERYYSGHEDSLRALMDELIRERKPLKLLIDYYKTHIAQLGYLVFIFRTLDTFYKPEDIYKYYYETLTTSINLDQVPFLNGNINQNIASRYIYGLCYSTLLHDQTPEPIVRILGSVAIDLRNERLKKRQIELQKTNEDLELYHEIQKAIDNTLPLKSFFECFISYKKIDPLTYLDSYVSLHYSEEDLEHYIQSLLEKSYANGALILPRQNNKRDYSKLFFGKDISVSISVHKGQRFSDTFRRVTQAFGKKHTKKALVQEGEFKFTNDRYLAIGTDSETIAAFAIAISNREPLGIALDILYDCGQFRIMSYLMVVIFSKYDESEITTYICETYQKHLYEQSTSFGRRTIVRSVFGIAITSIYERNTFSRASVFCKIIETAYHNLHDNYNFVSMEFKREFIEHLKQFKYLDVPYQRFNRNYGKNSAIGFVEHIVSAYGQDHFEAYLQECLKTYREANSEYVTVDIQRASKKIFGFTFHSLLHSWRATRVPKTLIKGFYTVWFKEYGSNFKTYKNRRNIYKILDYDVQATIINEKRIVGFDAFIFDDLSEAQAIEQVETIIKRLISKRVKISKLRVYCILLGTSKANIIDNYNSLRRIRYYKAIEQHIKKRIIIAGEEYIVNNIAEINSNKDRITIFYKYSNSCRSAIIRFDFLKSSILRDEVKQFFKIYYNLSRAGCRAVEIQKLIKTLVLMEKRFGVQKLADITKEHIYMILHFLQSERENSISTLKTLMAVLSAIMECYRRNTSYLHRIDINPCDSIHLKNSYMLSKNTEVIPDIVAFGIDCHKSKLPMKHLLIYELLIITGCRMKEISSLQIDDVYIDTTDTPVIRYIPFKVEKARMKSGLPKYEEKMIPKDLRDALIRYIDETEPERTRAGTKDVFFNIHHDTYVAITPSIFNTAMNNLIKENDIVMENGDYWTFSSRSVRKSVAIKLIQASATLYEVQAYLGHFTPDTTGKYYAEADKMKTATKNTEFFREQFKHMIGEEHLKSLTKDQHMMLYHEYLLQDRKVPLGICNSTASDSKCHISDRMQCLQCSKLCLSEEHLEKWKFLYSSNSERLLQLERLYDDLGIKKDEYSKFTEYQEESQIAYWQNKIIERIEGVTHVK